MGKGMLRGCQGPGARRAVGRGPGEGGVGRVDRKDGGGEGGNGRQRRGGGPFGRGDREGGKGKEVGIWPYYLGRGGEGETGRWTTGIG